MAHIMRFTHVDMIGGLHVQHVTQQPTSFHTDEAHLQNEHLSIWNYSGVYFFCCPGVLGRSWSGLSPSMNA